LPKNKILIETSWIFAKNLFLGVISATTYIAGTLYNFSHKFEKEFKDVSPILWALLVFILGYLALDDEIEERKSY
jgi:hypothetical protein